MPTEKMKPGEMDIAIIEHDEVSTPGDTSKICLCKKKLGLCLCDKNKFMICFCDNNKFMKCFCDTNRPYML